MNYRLLPLFTLLLAYSVAAVDIHIYNKTTLNGVHVDVEWGGCPDDSFDLPDDPNKPYDISWALGRCRLAGMTLEVDGQKHKVRLDDTQRQYSGFDIARVYVKQRNINGNKSFYANILD